MHSQVEIKTWFILYFLFQNWNKIKNRIKMVFLKQISRSVSVSVSCITDPSSLLSPKCHKITCHTPSELLSAIQYGPVRQLRQPWLARIFARQGSAAG